MIFLNPGILWLLPLAALPLVSLLVRPRRGRTVAWGAGRFLVGSAASATRWQRCRLALRVLLSIAALLCLVLGAARPLAWPGAWWWRTAAPEAIVVCPDRSPARAALVADGRPQQQVLIETMQRRLLPLADASRLLVADGERGTTLRVDGHRLAAYPGLTVLDVPTDLPRLLNLALDRLEADAAGSAEIWLGTGDLHSAWQPEQPAWAALRQRLDRQRDRFRVRWFRPPVSRSGNLSLRVAASSRDDATGAAWVRIAIRGRSSQSVGVVLRVDGEESVFAIPPWPGEGVVQELPIGAAGDAARVGDVRLPDDANPADNTAYFAIGARRPQRALIACGNPASARVAAAAVAPDPTDPWRTARVGDAEDISADALADTALVVIDHLPQTAGARAALQTFVESGGMVFIVPDRGSTTANWLGVTREPPAPAGEAQTGHSVEGAEGLCQGLPLDHLRARNAAGLRGGTILATWDDDRSQLVRAAAGRGAAVWCAASLDPKESNLADGVVLVPLLQRLLAAGARRLDPVERHECGGLPPDPARRSVLPAAPDADRSAGLKAGILCTQTAGGGAETTLVLERPLLCDDAAVVSVATVRGLVGAALIEDSGAAAVAPREGSAALLYGALVLLGLELLLATGQWLGDAKRMTAEDSLKLAESFRPRAGLRLEGGGSSRSSAFTRQLSAGFSRSGRPQASVRERLGLGLQALGLVLAVTLALRPERVVTTGSGRQPVVLLLDDSGSMQAPDGDATGSTRAAAARRLSRALRAGLERQGRVAETTFGATPGSGGASDIHAALTTAIARQPAAVVLLSDGAWNAGADPRAAALAAAAAGVPVFCVCFGRPEPLPNLRLAEVSVPGRGALGDTIVIGANVVNALPEPWSGEITLSAGGTRVAARQVTLPAHSERWESLRWRPQTPGTAALTLAVPVPPGDTLPADNTLTAAVQIDREPRRVLIVDDQPRWEFRAALRALRADPAVQVQAFLLDAARQRDTALPPDLQGEDAAADDSSRDRLPEFPDRDALAAYDAVILGAVRFGDGTGTLPVQAATDLARGVETAGLGLILLPGGGAGPAAWARSPLSAILPVSPVAADKQVRSRTAFQPQLTAEARGSGILALGDTPEDDAKVWQHLPGLRHYNRCGPALPGSVVLALLPEESRESLSLPLVVFRRTGLGRVLYLGSDDLWRWRTAGGGEPHSRFWRGAVRAVARRSTQAEGSAWRLLVEGSPAAVGAPVIVHALPVAESVDTATTALACTVRGPQGLTVRLRLAAGAAAGAVLTGTVALPEAGKWEVVPEGETTAAATLEVLARALDDPAAAARPEVLDAVSAVSAGRRFAVDQAEALVTALEEGRSAMGEPRRLRLWAQPLVVALAVLLLGLGWALQARRG